MIDIILLFFNFLNFFFLTTTNDWFVCFSESTFFRGWYYDAEVATMDNNQLSGTMPCSFMNTTGALKVLTADCLGAPNRPSPPLITCDCCTQCF